MHSQMKHWGIGGKKKNVGHRCTSPAQLRTTTTMYEIRSWGKCPEIPLEEMKTGGESQAGQLGRKRDVWIHGDEKEQRLNLFRY